MRQRNRDRVLVVLNEEDNGQVEDCSEVPRNVEVAFTGCPMAAHRQDHRVVSSPRSLVAVFRVVLLDNAISDANRRLPAPTKDPTTAQHS